MKKVVLVLLLAALVAGVTFAQDLGMSAGGGFKFVSYTDTTKSGGTTVTDKPLAYGVNLFFDAKYVEVNVDYLYRKYKFGSDSYLAGWTYTYNFLGLGVVGKYPFAIGDKFTLFPYAGIDFLMLMSVKLTTASGASGTFNTDKSDLNRFSFVFGVGGDYQINDQLYIRLAGGVGIGLDNKSEKDATPSGSDTKRTHIQIPIKLCVGYKL